MFVFTAIVIRITDRMYPSPILFIIHTMTLGTMLNFNGDNNGHGLEHVTCKQTIMPQIRVLQTCRGG